MTQCQFYKINKSQLILEDFGDETVIVHVDSGFYYSASGSGSRILELIETGYSATDLVAILLGTRDHGPGAEAEIHAFLQRLLDEGIIIERAAGDAASPTDGVAAINPPDETAWLPPVLERFDEVRDLLLIDPVHQVDENYGWPKAR